MRSHLQDDVVIKSGRNGDLHNWRILGIFRLGRGGAFHHALPTMKCKCVESRYDPNGRPAKSTLGGHQRMAAREGICIKKEKLMWDLMDSVRPKSIDHSRFLGLNELVRWNLPCTRP